MNKIILSFFILVCNFSIGQSITGEASQEGNSTMPLQTCFLNNQWSVQKDGKYGLYDDKNKKIIIPIQYDNILGTHDNGKIISVVQDKKSFLIDTKNKLVSKKYDDIRFSYFKSILIAEKDNKEILLDLNGKEIGQWYDKIFSTSGAEIFTVQLGNLWGIADISGNIKIPLKYQSLELNYGTKKISAKLNNQWGIINSDDTVLVDFNYDFVKPDFEEYIVQRNSKKGLLNSKNQLLVEYIYDDISGTSEKLYSTGKYRQVRMGDNIGIIDSTGQLIIPIEYNNLNFFKDFKYDKRIIALKNNKWGIITFNNNVILPFIYEKIKRDGYSDIMEYIVANPNEKDKFKNWDFTESDFIYFLRSNGEYMMVNEKQEVIYQK